jgi:hypothetical protein
MPGKRKATAKRFGVLESPRKKRVSVKVLATAKGHAAKGGAAPAGGLKGVAGCPRLSGCPHPPVFSAGT